MKYLVTGGSGFIGSHLVDELCRRGHQVVIYDVEIPKLCQERGKFDWICADIRDSRRILKAVFESDGVFHLAGLLGTAETMWNQSETADTNVCGSLRVFDAIKRAHKKAVYITLGNDWENPYTITKTAAARFALMYNREFGTQITVVRGLNVYGGRQKWFPIQKVTPKFIMSAIRSEPIPVFGDGMQTIDLVYIDDTVQTLIKALETDIEEQYSTVIDAGTGMSTPVKEWAQMIIDTVGSKSQLIHLPMRPGEPIQSKTLGNIAAVKELLGFVPKTPLRDGLKQTVEWYKKHHKTLQDGKELYEAPLLARR